MYWFLIILNVIVAITLMGVVMMQSSKGDGLSASFGGGSFGTVFGVRRTADFLQKLTIGLASALLVISLAVNMWCLPTGSVSSRRASVLQDIEPPTPGQMPNMQRSAPAAQPQQQK
jgi:preprotein translocase subunit SecG